MPLSLSASELLSDLSADATTISFDLPNGGYDRLHALLEEHNLLPQTKRGRMTVVALMLLATRVVKQQIGSMGPIANFLKEVSEDGVREEAKRIIETLRGRVTPDGAPATDAEALWQMDDAARGNLLALYGTLDEKGREQFRAQLIGATVVRLASIAHLTPDQMSLVLDLTTPRRTHRASVPSKTVGVLATVNDFFFPWMRETRRTIA